jgi:hypothetical protein
MLPGNMHFGVEIGKSIFMPFLVADDRHVVKTLGHS